MKLKQITPYKYVIKVANYTQYYNNNKMLQVKWSGPIKESIFVDLISGKILKRMKG